MIVYEILQLIAGHLSPSPNEMDKIDQLEKELYGFTILFWTTLWLVKATFLSLIRNNNQFRWLRMAWWSISLITLLTYIGCGEFVRIFASSKYRYLKHSVLIIDVSSEILLDIFYYTVLAALLASPKYLLL